MPSLRRAVPDVILPVLDEARRPAVGARRACRAGYRPIVVDNGSTRRLRRDRAARSARAWSTSRRGASAPPAGRAAGGHARRSSASWTATGRSIRASCRGCRRPVLDGDADLVLGARSPEPRRLAAARPGRQPPAGARAAPAHRRAAPRPRADARGAPRARCSSWGSPTAASAGRWRWCCARRPRAGASTRSPSRYRPRGRALEGHRHGARDRARGARHGAGRWHERRSGRARQGPAARAQQDAAVPAVHAARGGGAGRGRAGRHARRGRWRRRPPGACSSSTARPATGCRPASRSSPQRGDGLDERLAHAFADVGGPALLVGMDTPQVTPGAARPRPRAARRAGDRRRPRRRARRRLLGHRPARPAPARLPRRADEHRATPARGSARGCAQLGLRVGAAARAARRRRHRGRARRRSRCAPAGRFARALALTGVA